MKLSSLEPATYLVYDPTEAKVRGAFQEVCLAARVGVGDVMTSRIVIDDGPHPSIQ